MTLPAVTYALSLAFLVFLIQVVSASLGVVPGVACGFLLGAASLPVTARVRAVRPWTAAVIVAASSAVGIVFVCFLGRQTSPSLQLAFAPAFALAGSVIVNLFSEKGVEHTCVICSKRYKEAVFTCPRCEKPVCDQEMCWSYEGCRCSRCQENQVPILPREQSWWTAQFGQSTIYGRCHLCLEEGIRTDLFNCKQCNRPHCRRCWDDSNGQCSVCKWVVTDLPATLQPYMQG